MLYFLHHAVLHHLVIRLLIGDRSEAQTFRGNDALRARIRRHDNNRVLKIDLTSLRVRDMAVVENLQENVYWLTTLDNYYFRGFNGETAYEETIKGITPAKIQAFAKKLLGQGNQIEVVMEP